MKKVCISLIIILTSQFSFSQNDQYIKTMLATIEKLKSAKTVDALQPLAKQFENMINTEKFKWEPYYYAAYTYINMSYLEKKNVKKDEYLDLADRFLEKAVILNSKESEIQVLFALSSQKRIFVSPVTRGKKYVNLSNEYLEKAKKLNAENPRIYHVNALNVYLRPSLFGGGAAKAKPLFQEAKGKFAKFKPADALAPNWGNEENEKFLQECGK